MIQDLLLKAILDEFYPRFTPGGRVIFVSDGGEKPIFCLTQYLARLGLHFQAWHDMPNVVIHHAAKGWLTLVDAASTRGPITVERRENLKKLFKGHKADLIFVTAFDSRQAMQCSLTRIAWWTDVWLIEEPDHLIHFDGGCLLGPFPDGSVKRKPVR
jgi:adenine-specific DNA-methyltransferase